MKPLERIKEASTWAGLGLIVTSIGPLMADYKNPFAWFTFVSGAVAVIKKERGVS